eukprot:scaffold26714_cov160-Skeletonema_menzelii.AAC.4
MRFLLKSSRAAASAARDANKLLSTNNAHNAATEHAAANITGKAWGQHCSPDCGCVLRFELELSNNHVSPALSTTETVAAATYHAKRVMVTKATHSSQNDENRTSSSSSSTLKPLLTSEPSSTSQRPILTPCTCTTLHELAQQVVSHLPGRTMQQLRNDIELGVVGSRSSMAFRHTVLRENVLPALSEKKDRSWKKFGEMSTKVEQQPNEDVNNINGGGIHEMNSTQQHGRCFDLVEDSFLSMIHERAMPPRKDDKVHAYSPTMGGYFRMYSPSGRQQQKQQRVPSQHSSDEDEIDNTGYTAMMRRNDSLSSQSGGDWLQKSPSSYFLFGDDSSSTKSSYSDGMLSLFVDYAKESIFGRGDNVTAATSAVVENGSRPNTYLQLLDMYGGNHSEHVEKEEEPYDDWLDYVDTQSQGQS